MYQKSLSGWGTIPESYATPWASTSEKPEGYGLRSLRERAEHAGGTVTAIPTPTGFQLTTILPLREA